MTSETWAVYLGTAMLLTMTPGLDTAIVLRTSAQGGPRRGAAAALGIALGCLCWGSAAACGLAAILATWPLAFKAMKLSGAAYLIWLGLRLLLRPRHTSDPAENGSVCPLAAARSFSQGFTTNILNPKVGLFYLTLLPQFVPRGGNTTWALFQLALAHVILALVWFVVLAGLTGIIRSHLRRPSVSVMLDRVSGTVFFGFGVGLVIGH